MTLAKELAVSLVLSLSFAGGCGTLHQTGALEIAQPVPQDAGEGWEQVVSEHTRKVEVYRWAIRTIDLRATLVTPRLRTAFIAAEDRLHGDAADQMRQDLVNLGAPPDEGVDAPMLSGPGAEQEVIVYAAFYVADQKNRDLAAGYSIWDTTLVRGAATVEPISIETLKYSPSLVALLPHVDRFDEIYAIRFPMTDARTGTAMMAPGDEPLRLEVRSAIGNAIVSWTPTAQ